MIWCTRVASYSIHTRASVCFDTRMLCHLLPEHHRKAAGRADVVFLDAGKGARQEGSGEVENNPDCRSFIGVARKLHKAPHG